MTFLLLPIIKQVQTLANHTNMIHDIGLQHMSLSHLPFLSYPPFPSYISYHLINSQLFSPFPPRGYPHLAIENALQQHGLWFLCSHIGITGLLRHEDTTNLTQFLIHLVELLQGSWERNRLGCVSLNPEVTPPKNKAWHN